MRRARSCLQTAQRFRSEQAIGVHGHNTRGGRGDASGNSSGSRNPNHSNNLEHPCGSSALPQSSSHYAAGTTSAPVRNSGIPPSVQPPSGTTMAGSSGGYQLALNQYMAELQQYYTHAMAQHRGGRSKKDTTSSNPGQAERGTSLILAFVGPLVLFAVPLFAVDDWVDHRNAVRTRQVLWEARERSSKAKVVDLSSKSERPNAR